MPETPENKARLIHAPFQSCVVFTNTKPSPKQVERETARNSWRIRQHRSRFAIAALAQQVDRVRRIGVLMPESRAWRHIT